MIKIYPNIIFFFLVCSLLVSCSKEQSARQELDFTGQWKFSLADVANGQEASLDDSSWRQLDLPHDWSIELPFEENSPTGVGGGALRGGIGWYRKNFTVNDQDRDKQFFVEFDGVYMNSEVWINGHYLGKRPSGYISFRYELSPYLHFGDSSNVIAVKVDNSKQPNSRWYSGSGIYRNVRLVIANPVRVDHWGTFITSSNVTDQSATVKVQTKVLNATDKKRLVILTTELFDAQNNKVAETSTSESIEANAIWEASHELVVNNPLLWSLEEPSLYRAVSTVSNNNETTDTYHTTFGIRTFNFDINEGFSLNGVPVKINGVCMHHDLGALGAVFNVRAAERQLEIMKEMGVNALRTSHNPPDPQLLDLCDKMGIIVMDEMFDMWKLKKSEFDYSLYWDEWHQRDLEDFITRDRNHASVMMWSIGNEIIEQYNHADSAGAVIAKELAGIVRKLDSTRPIVTANNDASPDNSIIKSGALDLLGYNYNQGIFERFHTDHPNQKFIATETVSGLATRGHYDMPSDSIRRWPIAWDKPFTEGNPDHTVSAYDHVSAPWGSTHEETWKIIKKHKYLPGQFIWTGFDYIGEPTPYGWPSRSSYFGLVDLAGFPKDAFYMYQSEWTNKAVLHLFPHWNWDEGKIVDVWAYYNQADEVELYLNGKSLGIKKKEGDDLHVQWRVPFEAGTLKAISRKEGKDVLSKEIKTSGKPAKIVLEADRNSISADGKDLSFITLKILDADGNIVPYADNMVQFDVQGAGFIAGLDNGNPVSHESFKGNTRKAFHGLALIILQSHRSPGRLELKATAEGLEEASIAITTK